MRLLGRVALVRGVAGYSHQTLPWMIYWSVGRSVRTSVCPVHCGKTADRIRMPFGVIGRTGPGIRQVVGLGIGPREGVLLGANLRRAIVTGDFSAYVCDSASTVGAAVCGDACGGPRHCCIRWGSTSYKGRGRFWGVFVLDFHNGKRHWVADGEMFPIRMRKLDNISVRQTFRWKARFVGFYSVLRSKLGFMRN